MEQKNELTSGSIDLPISPDLIYQYPCPYLGASKDPVSVMSYPTESNRCYAFGASLEVDRQKQTMHCLTEEYASCHIFQQVLELEKEKSDSREKVRFLGQILRTRPLALAAMLLLILLAALIWWPLPGMTVQDGTVFSAQILRNTEYVQSIMRETAVENEPQAAVESKIEAESSAPAVVAERSDSETGIQQTAPQPTAVPLDISILPDLYQLFQIQQDEDFENSGGDFNPIAYSSQGVEIPSLSSDSDAENMIRIHLVLPEVEKGQSLNVSRFELLNLLGRDSAGEWIKVRTDSGIEGWVEVKETGLANSLDALSTVEKTGADEEAQSISTTLPEISTAAVRDDRLTMHVAPRVRFQIITTIEKGEPVSLLGRWREGPWVRIRLEDGTEGWVNSDGLAAVDS